VCSSPKLIAAYHVLHRLSEPRHPPYALKCFKRVIAVTRHLQLVTTLRLEYYFPNMSKSYRFSANADVKISNLQAFRLHHYYFKNFCGGYRDRTDDP
jgi:hypothetical protein